MTTRSGNRRLELIAREVAAEGDLPDDPDEAAAYVARQIRLERPDVTSLGAQRAAADVVPGASRAPTSGEAAAILEDADRRSVRGRAGAGARRAGRGARAGARAGGRRASRAVRRVRRRREFSNPFRGASSGVGLVAQAFGLAVLYWLVRNPGAVETVTGGARRVLEWISGPGGVPAPEPARGGVGVGVSAEGVSGIVGGTPGAPGGVPTGSAYSAQVERWRGLVARYFPSHQVPKAMDVLDCESEGNPNARNPTSGASGLFQHIPRYFAARAAAAGFPGADIMDPEANVAAAAWLWRREGWSPWECA